MAGTVIYLAAGLVAVVIAVSVDRWVTRTRLVGRQEFWIAYAIIACFQLVSNGLLTGIPVVTYDPAVIVGIRLVHAPVEDLLFGFAMILLALAVWVRTAPGESDARRGERGR